MVRRILMLGVLFLTGCQSTVGPFQARSPQRVDPPNVALTEQEARARNRWALPDESRKVAPPSGNEFLGWR
jgi:hypothetical protein